MKKLVGIVALLFSLALSGSASAHTTYYFEADYVIEGYGDFHLQYTDADDDGRFSRDELVPGSFSGVYLYAGSTWGWQTFTVLDRVPVYDAVISPLTDGDYDGSYNGPLWLFLQETGPSYCSHTAASWRLYSQTPVPLPPTVLLLGSGILGLVGWRRFRRS